MSSSEANPTIPSTITHACCADPAPAISDYTLKGDYKPYGPFEKAYIVGPADTNRAIIFVYDIFGYHLHTQQGADILSEGLGALVVVPDFAREKAYNVQRFSNPPPGVNVGQEILSTFFAVRPQFFEDRVNEVKEVAKQLRSDGKTFVGTLGLCWGGRVVLTVGGAEEKLVDAVASTHPAQLKQDDIGKVRVPVALYPAKTDQIDLAEKIVNEAKNQSFGATSDFKAYRDMHHGWTGAHANLDDEKNLAQYKDVYGRLVNFFTNSATSTAGSTN
ncbi:Alpha/Beta hydrolase protein [Cantharellus anzutake]|uniref:Alpha/Beta hydrolase protein n=1 Tax=Cantharellus anzutake TaxID=1750568 RepID=UPI0019072E2F|nr:Alpha/Beta hydrolase protein [Cantharellus anzutake]KAF8334114.1 Alpha/Beta hydrolase protein [Cantharellus anzutake]